MGSPPRHLPRVPPVGAPVLRRLAAHLLDVGLFIGPWALGTAVDPAVSFGAIVASAVAQVAMQFVKGRSVGKWLLGLRVIGEDGLPMDAGRLLLLRNAIPAIVFGFCGIVALVDVVLFFMPPHQRLLDKYLRARVIEDPR